MISAFQRLVAVWICAALFLAGMPMPASAFACADHDTRACPGTTNELGVSAPGWNIVVGGRLCGEQYDQALGLYYLRARLMNPLTGRFWTADTYEGQNSDPASLHKYLYGNADPVTFSDPSGFRSGLAEQTTVVGLIGAGVTSAAQLIVRIVVTGSATIFAWKANDEIARYRMEKKRQEVKAEVDTAVALRRYEGRLLFHYTDEESAIAIVAESKISFTQYTARNPISGVYHPRGAYATDIAPWEHVTQYQLANMLYAWNEAYAAQKWREGKTSYAVALFDQEPRRFRYLEGREYVRTENPWVYAPTYVENPNPRQ